LPACTLNPYLRKKMLPKNLGELLNLSAKKHAHRTAIVFGRKKISYKELDSKSRIVANNLINLGIREGERVAIFLDNCPEFVVSYFAVMKAGLVAVPVNYMFKIEEAKFILSDSQASCLITSRTYLDLAEELRLRLDSLKYIITITEARNGILNFPAFYKHNSVAHNNPCGPNNTDDLAVILYTSGTTGTPKGAMLSHRNLITNANDCSKAIRVNAKDTVICILPLFHSFAATVCMNLPLLIGAKIIILKSVRPFKRILRSIRKNRVTIFVGVPSIFNILKDIRLPRIFRNPLFRIFNPLKVCISGAAALPTETLISFQNKFKIPLLEGYGLTEASPVVTLNPLRGKRKAGSIGKPLADTINLRIVDDNGNATALSQTGELLVQGPNVMQGYYKQTAATKETIKEGWLYTGDMARQDEDGYIYIVGRKKEMVNVRGLNVYPREIEEVLYQNPKVKEAAVIGIPDIHKGEVPKAFVVLKEGNDSNEHELLHYLRERLAPYKIPKNIELRSNLPKNNTGKILKRLLQEEEQKINA